jgi:hypothetical protein
VRVTKTEFTELTTRQSAALLQAVLALKAIGEPEPLDPPDARVCAVIAKGALVRIADALGKDI